MIISHKYKFIFVKSKKVAGTSLELALSKHLDKDDVITPVHEEGLRVERGYATGKHYRKKLSEIRLADVIQWNRLLLKQFYRRYKSGVKITLPARPRKYYAHMPAKEIKQAVAKDIWESYFKFTIERNPWDLVVSYYYFWMRHNSEMPFEEFVSTGVAKNASNWDFYMDGDTLLVDKVVKYEEFDTELAGISRLIGYPENLYDIIKGIRAKSHLRQVRDYHKLYNDETRDIIARQFARQIAMFNYTY